MPRNLITLLLPLMFACGDKDTGTDDGGDDTGPTDTTPVELTTFYVDADGDGYGNPDVTLDAETQPSNYVADNTDCDDGDASINPGADEVCNGDDDNCDGTVDTDAVDLDTFYVDADDDGYGDPKAVMQVCDWYDGLVTDSTDCDDTSASAYPGADEVCNGADDDCDGTDDEDPIDPSYFYADSDEDGYGDPDVVSETCEQPKGTVENAEDCDDSNAAINPDAEDDRDGVDDDCDGADGFEFTDDLESYTTGSYICASSDLFSEWSGGTGTSEDALISDDVAYSGTNSIRFDEGEGDDVVLTLGPLTGSWVVEWYMYVDNGAYFNLQGTNTWTTSGDWQNSVYIDSDGIVYDDFGSDDVEVGIQEWILVEYYVDLDLGTQDLYIDGEAISSDTFDGPALGGIDFYPTPYSSSDEDIVFYVDDVSLTDLTK